MASTAGTNFWTGLRDNVTGLALDYARQRYVDVEGQDDDKNIPDQADLRYTLAGAAPAGVPLATWLLLGAALVAGVLIVRRLG